MKINVSYELEFAPCPFCGKDDLEITSKKTFESLVAEYKRACITVSCRECKLDLYDHTHRDNCYDRRVAMLAEKWNRRACLVRSKNNV